MEIAMCCTRNWYIYLAIELYALFKYNNIKKVYLFIEDDEIKFIKDDRIEFINVNKMPEYIYKTSPNYNTHFTKMSMIRCYFTKLLKCDKILYIDADAIVIDNIEELWNIDLKENVIAGVHENGEWDKCFGLDGFDNTYINSGVLLIDLKKIRNQKLDDEMIEKLNTKWYNLPDQDVINIVCKDKIMHISNIYNSTYTTGIVDNAKIVHYIGKGQKGWIKTTNRSEIWFKHHKEAILKGGSMENYKVIAKINFTDYLGKETIPSNEHYDRIAGKSTWNCTKERYLYLLEHNAVDLVEIEKIELPKREEEKEYTQEEKKKIEKELEKQMNKVYSKIVIDTLKEIKPVKNVNKTTKNKTTKKKQEK